MPLPSDLDLVSSVVFLDMDSYVSSTQRGAQCDARSYYKLRRRVESARKVPKHLRTAFACKSLEGALGTAFVEVKTIQESEGIKLDRIPQGVYSIDRREVITFTKVR